MWLVLRLPEDRDATGKCMIIAGNSRSQWPSGLRRGSAADHLLELRVQAPPGGIYVSCDCCALSVRGLCDGPISCAEESYQLQCA